MDLRNYYQRIRDVEAKLPGPYVLVESLPTPEGGKAGVVTEAPRRVAAKMIVDGTAKLATEAESKPGRKG